MRPLFGPRLTDWTLGDRLYPVAIANGLEWEEDHHPFMLERVTGIRNQARWIPRFALLLAAAFSIQAVRYAQGSPFWYDELFTISSSRYLSWTVWFAVPLKNGDFQPPLHYVITAAGMGLLPESELGARMPQLLGMLLALLFVYRYFARRLSPPWALLAMTALMVHFYYAAEARPYAQLLAATSALLWTRMKANESDHRGWEPAMAAAVAWALLNHLYGVLLLVPLAAAEVARSHARKRPDFRRWLWLSAAASPTLLLLPIVPYANTYGPTYWTTVDIKKPLETAVWATFGPEHVLLVPWACLLGALLIFFSRKRDSDRVRAPLPHDEVVFLSVLGAVPFLGAVIAFLSNGAYKGAYFIIAAIGLQALLVCATHHVARGRQWVAIGSAVAFLVPLASYTEDRMSTGAKHRKGLELALGSLTELDSEMPLVSNDPLSFLPIWYYAPEEIRARWSLFIDLGAREQIDGNDTIERSARDLAHWMDFEVLSRDSTFPDRFIVFGRNPTIQSVTGAECSPVPVSKKIPMHLCSVSRKTPAAHDALPTSAATSATFLPHSTSSMTRCRNSGG
jgi:hypothetical protein